MFQCGQNLFLYIAPQGRTVPIEIGTRYTDEAWGQKLLKFEAFIAEVVSGSTNKYLAQVDVLTYLIEKSSYGSTIY